MIIAGKLAYYCTKNEELQQPAGTRIFQKSACYTLISTFLINMASRLKKVFNICGNGQTVNLQVMWLVFSVGICLSVCTFGSETDVGLKGICSVSRAANILYWNIYFSLANSERGR